MQLLEGVLENSPKESLPLRLERHLAESPDYPHSYEGRGIVICAGGVKHFTNACVAIRLLRDHGCSFPVELWYLGEREISREMRMLVEPLGVECINAFAALEGGVDGMPVGRNLRPFALVHSKFRDVLLMDADNMAVSDPSFLFENEAFLSQGAMLWHAPQQVRSRRSIPGLPDADVLGSPHFDLAQVLVNKEKAWTALQLLTWLYENSQDNEIRELSDEQKYRLAFTASGVSPYTPVRPAEQTDNVVLQYAPDNNLLFEHNHQWDFFATEESGYAVHGQRCVEILDELRGKWHGRVRSSRRVLNSEPEGRFDALVRELTSCVWNYERVGYDSRDMTFAEDGHVILGRDAAEEYWDIAECDGLVALNISSAHGTTCLLAYDDECGQWTGEWLVNERMPIVLSKLRDSISPNEDGYVELFAPDALARYSLAHALSVLLSAKTGPYAIVEVSARRSLINGSASDAGDISSLFGWFVSKFGGHSTSVDVTERLQTTRKSSTADWHDVIDCQRANFQTYLRKRETPIDLLYMDFGEAIDPQSQAAWVQCYQSLAHKPEVIVIGNLDGRTRELLRHKLVAALSFDGYVYHPEETGHIWFSRGVSIPLRDDTGTVLTYPTIMHLPTVRITKEHMYSRPYEAEVYAPGRGNFPSLRNRNVLIYWPHGVGDWVFLSNIIPVLNRSNRYFVTRYGDDTVALFDGSEYATPLYIGVNSPHCGDGKAYHNEHFTVDYDTIDGSTKMLELPLGLYEQCRKNDIDTFLFHSFYEVYGWRDFPFHTKGRNTLPELVDGETLNSARLDTSLRSAVNPHVDSWVKKWIESRLESFTGREGRKLCLICRNGYTSTSKNWGHKWREDMPEGKQNEGEEARDFMRLLLDKDPNWIFLTFEDRLFNGYDTLRDASLNSFSYADVFNTVGDGCAPYALILRALMEIADLCIGVPVGPYHLSMAYPNLPSVGLWIDHIPSWYDEPKSGSINIINSHAIHQKYYDRPGSFDERELLNFHARHVDTRIITGDQVFSSVEELLY